jgi:hypothetical protein
MTVQATIVSLLQGVGLTVYPLTAPGNGTYPNVTYQRVTTVQVRTHSGVALERPRMQLSCWAKTYAECVATSQTVKAALDQNQTDFKLATKANEMDVAEAEPGYYRIILEYVIWVNPS